jgi:hypothetical protein
VSRQTIERAWQGFYRATAHPQTPPSQKAEMRRIFFAGWVAATPIMLSATTHTLLAIDEEIAEFTKEIEALARLASGPTGGSA